MRLSCLQDGQVNSGKLEEANAMSLKILTAGRQTSWLPTKYLQYSGQCQTCINSQPQDFKYHIGHTPGYSDKSPARNVSNKSCEKCLRE